MKRGKENQEQLEQRVLHFIRENRLIPSQEKVVVAVSGGPDSVCLLYVLVNLQQELGITLHIAHLNHQLRGTESEADAQYVADLAHRLGIPATTERREVKAYQAQKRISLEEAAREVRYAFLAQVADSVGAERVAVGRTADDHIETILMHLIRGTGTRGLRGLQPYTRWQSSGDSLAIIRPLLSVTRRETATYCQHHQLTPRLDASNLSLSPLRNRIRQQLLPLLQSYNPQVTRALLRTAHIVVDDLAFLDEKAAAVWDEVVQEYENNIVLNKERFLQLPSALQRNLLRMSIEKLLGNLRDIEMRHIEEIMEALSKPAGKRLNLPGGLIFSIEYDKYLIGSDLVSLSPFPSLEGELSLNVPGETLLPGWCVTATIVDREQMAGKDDNFIAYFDYDKTGERLLVRTRRYGDRFQPLGMSQPKKLGEFMIDAKIPRAWRGQIPIVCSPRHILWVVGWQIDERVKVTEETKQVLCLKFERRC
ncbi:MAG: tRNA lysidine(34) synthetase TilS [Dehalococcoidales bacterium]|nr:tRNA lysidine(34) synthetase TilS [Dehalococcoidales bacterium]